MVFVVETSTKVTSKDLEGVKKLIQAFATHHAEKNTVRLGVMTFSKDIQIIRKLQVLNNDGSPVLKRTLTQLTSEPAIGDALEEATNHLIQHTSSSQNNNRKVIVSIVKTLNNKEIAKARNIVFKMQQRVKDLQVMSIVFDDGVKSNDLLKVVSPLATVPKATNILIAPIHVDRLSTSASNKLASKMIKGIITLLCMILSHFVP